MPDEDLPPAPSEAAESPDDTAKAETIRITLPAKSETPTAKRETVRINLPGKSAGSPIPPPGVTPKKETTKITMGTPTPAAPPAAAPAPAAEGAPRPFVPPPPRPPGSAPIPPSRPMAGAPAGGPPKPPTLSKPTVPLKPAPATAPSGVRPAPGAPMKPGVPSAPSAAAAPEPMTQKAAAPKKETARITLPPQGAQGGMPKATVKMQQTQPLVRQPAASTIQTSPVIQSMPASYSGASSEPDNVTNVLAIVAFVVALGAAVFAFLGFSASALS